MKKVLLALLLCATGSMGGCVSAMGLKPSYGVVVVYQAVPGSSETKQGINAVSDEGIRLFGPSGLSAPKYPQHGGGTSSFGGIGIPKWVRVTWRKDTQPGEYWTTGTVIGDYKVEVASRIPPEVLQYASEKKGRAIRLIFRIKDDGVLLGWDVQEVPPRGGGGWVRSLHGGDFPCDPMTPYETQPSCTSGYLKDAPWYHP